MTKQELIEKLKDKGLYKYYEKLEPRLRNAIRLYLTSSPENEIKVGQTKIGGQPDLPQNISWLTDELTSKSLSFVAQINLSEISLLDSENLLPNNGILYFFYTADQEAWGFDIKDKTKFKVLHYSGELNNLKRVDFPNDLDEYSRFQPCTITPKQEISLPPYGGYSSEFYRFFNREKKDKFYDIVCEEITINKLLGYSDNIQNEMELECELVTNGLFCGDPSGYNDPRAKELEPNAINWNLLLQIDSNDECKMMWGDIGRLYFWIKKQDLIEGKFENCWFSLQCF